jgi:hypothetical protein
MAEARVGNKFKGFGDFTSQSELFRGATTHDGPDDDLPQITIGPGDTDLVDDRQRTPPSESIGSYTAVNIPNDEVPVRGGTIRYRRIWATTSKHIHAMPPCREGHSDAGMNDVEYGDANRHAQVGCGLHIVAALASFAAVTIYAMRESL